MDAINANTRSVNRLINGSSFIYDDENDKTFAEIRSTVEQNINPNGSMIRGRLIILGPYDINCHSIITVVDFITISIMGIEIIHRIAHIIMLAYVLIR